MSAIALMIPTTDDRDESQIEAELDALSTEELLTALHECMALTVKALRQAGRLVKALEKKGVDIQGLRLSRANELRRIAYGQLLPEVIERFGCKPLLCRKISALPLPDQRRLADGKLQRVVIQDGARTTHQLVDPLEMDKAQIKQVFADDHIRDDAQQARFIRNELAKEQRRRPDMIDGFCLDYEREGAKIGRIFVPLRVLEALARALRK